MTEEYPYTPLYYNVPTQVKFYEQGKYYGGIGYKDIIIDGHSGSVMSVEKVVQNAVDEGIEPDQAIIELDWISLNEDIIWGK